MEFDLIIRNALLVDGSGEEPLIADVAVKDGCIAHIGPCASRAPREIDAEGLLLTPGFVDIHTHYDGQVTWDNRLIPSSHHGVTTAVIGNCGVGFAPCRADQHDLLMSLMEGVEDIPHPVLSEGLSWCWESYPDYLDLLAARHYDMDVASLLPHAPLRVYVMGERALGREPATPEDLRRMRALLAEGMAAGAIGFGTSQTLMHRASDGSPIPTLAASREELMALAGVLGEFGSGVVQVVNDFYLDHQAGVALMRELATASGGPLVFSMGAPNRGPFIWPEVLALLSAASDEGVQLYAQVMTRAIGMVLGIDVTLNPFYACAGYREVASLPLAERLVALRDPVRRQRILDEPPVADATNALGALVRNFDFMFELGSPPDYEQPLSRSIAARAHALGVRPEAFAYDLLVGAGEGGAQRLYLAFANYCDGGLDAIGTMLQHPRVIPGLGDGGAHCGTICDAGYSTYLLQHWARDRASGRLSLARAVKALSYDTARVFGLRDRGLIRPGYRADLNLIDFDALALHSPEVCHDLPAGGRRLVQRASGYVGTFVAGTEVYRHGEPTGALPGRLVRGARAAPRH